MHLHLPALLLLTGAGLLAQGTDALHYRLEIEPDFTAHTIAGVVTGTFQSKQANLTTLDLDLTSVLTVSAVQLGGLPLAFTRPTDVVHITLDRAYQLGEIFTVVINYGGAPPVSSSLGGWVWTTHSGTQMCWTLSQPWDAKTWWPGKDVLGDKATFEIWVTHPSSMNAASNGLLQGVDTLTGNRLRSRWATNYPMAAYLACLSVTNYQRRTDWYTGYGANMPVEYFVFPESFASWTNGMNLIVPMLNAYSSAFGQYPFVNEKYGLAQFTFGGGMEHQTITGQNSAGESLSAHELAHQWWGDAITCATWGDIWLNEGFATFCEAIWYERKTGGTLASYLARMVTNRPTNLTPAVYVTDVTNVNAIFSSNNVYRKGGWVVHMLRGLLGDTAFFQCLHDYRAAYEGGSATTADFRASCERTTGRDLGFFFDQWVMNAGAPSYTWAWRTRSVNGIDYAYVEIDQTQTSRPVFTMAVPMRATTATGTVTQQVWDDERNDQFVLRLGATGAATAMAFDPDQWILRPTPTSRTFSRPFFAATPETVQVAAGADIEFHADQGSAAANRPYLLCLSLSGSSPGTPLFGLTVPLNADLFTSMALEAVNTPVLSQFLGNLDASGQFVATFRLAPGLANSIAGSTLTGAYFCFDTFDFASRPVNVQLR